MSANISSIVFELGYQFSVYNSTPGFMWPEVLYDIYPRNFSAPRTVIVPIYGSLTNVTRDCGVRGMLNYESDTYNCAALSIAAILAQKHNFSLDDPSVREADEILGFGDLLSFDATGILRQIVGCASNSCGGPGMAPNQTKLLESEYGKCGQGIGNLSSDSINFDDLKPVLEPFKSLCYLVLQEIEADIAGPGIIVSYTLQISLCVWFFALSTIIPHEPSHSVFLWWVRVKRRLYNRVRKRKQPPEEMRMRSTLSRLRSSRFSVALFSAIIEFQETQLFLTLALQLATTFMVVVNEEFSTPMDLSAARSIVSGGTLMVLLTQTIIQRRGMHWWYTLVLTVIVGGLGIAIQFLIPATEDLTTLSSQIGCGTYRPSILALCPRGRDLRWKYDSAVYPIYFAVATSILVADQLRQLPWAVSKRAAMRENAGKLRGFLLNSSYVIWNLGWFILNVALFIMLLGNAVYVFGQVGETLSEMEKWSFGQVVAVLPWAPVVAKYIYYNIFGIKSGVGNRIDHHYKVVLDESHPEVDRKQSDTKKLDGGEYISLQNVDGDSRRTSDPEATGWGRASPAGEGPDGDLGSRVSRTSHL